MRFISPSGALRIVLIHEKTRADTDGFNRTVEPGYTVEFKQGLLDGFEYQLARERLHFSAGVRDRQNMDGSPFDYIRMAGVFDTEWIEDPELRAEVEQKMLANDGCGKADTFILVEVPKLPAPWPSYDDLKPTGQRTPEKVAQRNLETAQTIGVPVEDLIAYEKQERNHERILAVYEAELAKTPEPEDELVRA